MFDRKESKAKAKVVLKKSYWVCFLVSLVLLILSGNIVTYRYESQPRFLENPFEVLGNKVVSLFHETSGIAMVGNGQLTLENWVRGIVSLFQGQSMFISAFIFITIMVLAKFLFSVLINTVLEVGGKRFYLSAREGSYEFKNIFFAFKSKSYWQIVKVIVVRNVYTTLWFFVFIIPGIIAAYRYCFIPYILADDPSIEMGRAFELTKEMTDGLKMDLFILDISFLGWYLLNFITFGLATFFVNPYVQATVAEIYVSRKTEMENKFSLVDEKIG